MSDVNPDPRLDPNDPAYDPTYDPSNDPDRVVDPDDPDRAKPNPVVTDVTPGSGETADQVMYPTGNVIYPENDPMLPMHGGGVEVLNAQEEARQAVLDERVLDDGIDPEDPDSVPLSRRSFATPTEAEAAATEERQADWPIADEPVQNEPSSR